MFHRGHHALPRVSSECRDHFWRVGVGQSWRAPKLTGDLSEKKGQIAHLDRDPSNSDPDNLAFLCLEHHDEYDSRPSQSKGLTIEEVKRYRADLPAALARGGASESCTIVSSSQHGVRQFPRRLCRQFSEYLMTIVEKPLSNPRLLTWVEDLDDELLLVSAALASRPSSSCHVGQSWLSENSHPLGMGRSVPDLIQALLEVGALCNIWVYFCTGLSILTQVSNFGMMPRSAASWMRTQRLWQRTRVLISAWFAGKCLVRRWCP